MTWSKTSIFNNWPARTRSRVTFQAKATVGWPHEGTEVVYDLEAKAHNDLVERTAKVRAMPFILVLLCLNPEENNWLHVTGDNLILRKLNQGHRDQTGRFRFTFRLVSADPPKAVTCAPSRTSHAFIVEPLPVLTVQGVTYAPEGQPVLVLFPGMEVKRFGTVEEARVHLKQEKLNQMPEAHFASIYCFSNGAWSEVN